MGAVRGALVSSVGLVLLYDVIAPVDAAGDVSKNVPTLFALPGRLADYIINPKKPLIPDLRASSKSKGNLKTGLSGTVPDNSILGQIGQGPGGLLNNLGNLGGAASDLGGYLPLGGLSGSVAPGFPAAPSSSSSSSSSNSLGALNGGGAPISV